MCGGPSQQQTDAAAAQANLSNQQAALSSENNAITQPFFSNEVQNGLPFFNAQSQYSTSNLADQINQAKASQNANFAGYGGALPSGFAQSANRDLSIGGAKAFDQNQLSLLTAQQNEKDNAARTLAGQGANAASTAIGGNQSIMQAPLANNFWSNLVGGIVQGAGNIPFAFGG